MRVKEQKYYKWYKVVEKRMVADATITPSGTCKIIFEKLSPQNTVYLGSIGYRKVREIAKILDKIADLGEKEENRLEENNS